MDQNKNTDRFKKIIDVDRVIHEPSRLLIVAYLYVVEYADFLFLQSQTGLSRGNLSAHLYKLEESGYIRIDKEFVERTPRTILKLTLKGRKALEKYRDFIGSVFAGLK